MHSVWLNFILTVCLEPGARALCRSRHCSPSRAQLTMQGVLHTAVTDAVVGQVQDGACWDVGAVLNICHLQQHLLIFERGPGKQSGTQSGTGQGRGQGDVCYAGLLRAVEGTSRT